MYYNQVVRTYGTYVLLASMFPSHNYDYKQSTPVTLVIMYSRNESHVPMDHPFIMSTKGLGGSRKWPILLTFSTVFMLTLWVGQKKSKIMLTWYMDGPFPKPEFCSPTHNWVNPFFKGTYILVSMFSCVLMICSCIILKQENSRRKK